MITQLRGSLSGPMLLVVGISILGFSDNLVLVVSDSASAGQFHFIRSVFIIAGILLVARLMGLSVVPKRWPLMLIRTFCMVSAILLYFTAMPLMPIAEAGAGLFTSPIFVLMFSGIFLKEAIGLKQITMVVIGMVGMVLILTPNIGGLTLFHLFPLGAGAMYAIASMLTFRYLSGESPLAILLCFMLGIGICGGFITTVFSIFPVSQVWMNKALSAKIELEEINPDCRINPVVERIDPAVLDQLVASVDVVVDASDNFETRHAVNRACVKYSTPLVSGTAINYVGQLAVFDLRNENTPCYACFVPENTPSGVDQCSTSGVLASLTGTIGTMQATEVINLLVAGSSRMNGRAVLYDARESELSLMPIKKRSECAICS